MNIRPMLLTTAVICCLAIAPGGGPLSAQTPDSHESGHCRLAGTWLTENPVTGAVFFDTLGPMDPAERKLTYVSEWVNQDPSFGGLFPATAVTILRGEMVRTSRTSGYVSALAYGTADAGPGLPKEIIYATRLRGPFEVLDCDTLVYEPGTVSIFLPGQDPLGEDPPALCIPYTAFFSKRVEAAPMCEVLPP